MRTVPEHQFVNQIQDRVSNMIKIIYSEELKKKKCCINFTTFHSSIISKSTNEINDNKYNESGIVGF